MATGVTGTELSKRLFHQTATTVNTTKNGCSAYLTGDSSVAA